MRNLAVADDEPKLNIHIAEDRHSVTLSLMPINGGAGAVTFTL